MLKSFEHHGFFCRWLLIAVDNSWCQYLLITPLKLLPAGLFAIMWDQRAVDSGLQKDWPSASAVAELALLHPYYATIVFVVWAGLIEAGISWLHRRDRQGEGTPSNLLKLFEIFEQIVGAKVDRFSKFACAYIKQGGTSIDELGSVFKTITQPDQQIALLIMGLKGFFDAIDTEGVNFRVTLAKCDDVGICDWLYFVPQSDPPATEISRLRMPDSSISHCFATKKLVVIEDTRKEADAKPGRRKYVPSDNHSSDDCSLICYPIIHKGTNSVPYVITVVADKKGYFLQRKTRIYHWLFKHFAVRILVEHNLLLIKQTLEKRRD